MPKVVDQFLGRLRGKIGDVIFKITHGVSYAGRAPLPRLASQSSNAVSARKKFSLANKLGHAVNAIPQLQGFWKNFTLPGSAGFKTVVNKVMKKNYPHVTDSDLLDSVSLVPERGFNITATDFTLANNQIAVVLAPVGYADLINTAIEKYFIMTLVLFLKDPVNSEDSQFEFIHLKSSNTSINLINPLTFNIGLSSLDTDLFDAYGTRKAFVSLVTVDIQNVPVRYSNSIHSS